MSESVRFRFISRFFSHLAMFGRVTQNSLCLGLLICERGNNNRTGLLYHCAIEMSRAYKMPGINCQ